MKRSQIILMIGNIDKQESVLQNKASKRKAAEAEAEFKKKKLMEKKAKLVEQHEFDILPGDQLWKRG